MRQKEDAELVAHYLLGLPPGATSKQLYQKEISKPSYQFTTHEERIWNVAMKHSWLLPYIDAGLAITNKFSPLRRRIYAMFAILETETALAERFIYREKPFWLLYSAFYVIRAIFRAVVGSLLIRII